MPPAGLAEDDEAEGPAPKLDVSTGVPIALNLLLTLVHADV